LTCSTIPHKNIRLSFLLFILSSLSTAGAGAAICHQKSANMIFQVSPVVFASGEDTEKCGGTISTNPTQVTFTSIPLAVESNIIITQLVNITNTDDTDHSVQFSVSSENFGNELSSLKIYLVSPSGTETLVVELNDSGNVVTQNVPVNIPQSEERAIKLAGHYDSGTFSSQTNSITLSLQVV